MQARENFPPQKGSPMNMNTYGMNTKYGAWETNPLAPGALEAMTGAKAVHLGNPDLKKVTRLRLISDPGFPYWDVSYCWGELKDGTLVRVTLPVHQFRKRALKADIIAMGKAAGVFVKGLGLLDDDLLSRCQ